MPTTTITRVSTDSAGGQANGASGNPSISADGRFVAFTSDATNLVSGDTNNATDVFLKNLQTGITTRVSISNTGAQANGASLETSISGDGQLVAFTSNATNLVLGDTNHSTDAFVRDLQTGVTTRVSTDSLGGQANGGTIGQISMSADGRLVAFTSDASNLVLGDTNNHSDVFVKDLQTGVTTRVSVDSLGGQGNGDSSYAMISADGRYVTFTSAASNLVPGDSSDSDVFVRDLHTGVTTLVSTDVAGLLDNYSVNSSISADGQIVAYTRYILTGTSDFEAYKAEVWVKDLQTGAAADAYNDLATGSPNEPFRNTPAESISVDGRFVLWDEEEWAGRWNVFIKDVQSGFSAPVSVSATGVLGSYSGDADPTHQQGYHYLFDASSFNASFSADGRFIVFQSYATNLASGDTNARGDVFVALNPLLSLPSLTAGSDTWTGTAGNDTIDALAGNDSLDGAAGNDSLAGSVGNDTLVGGSGADTLYGGEGDDVYYVDASDTIGHELAGQGLDKVYSSGSFTLGSGLNQLFLTGSAASSGTGNDGNNLIGGNGGWNHLFGQGGADDLYGQGGNDTLDGGAGNDLLIGGAGSDRLTGGGGGDRFVFTGAEVTDATADLDIITDYSRAAGDVVDLADPVHGYTVIGVVGGALQIHLVGGNDIVQFDGITNVADILFV